MAKRRKTGVQVVTKEAEAQLSEFRKANDSIALKVVEGNMSLLSRRIYNSVVSAAQKIGKPGNVPSEELKNDAAAMSYFWVPLRDVIKDTAYNSNDYETLKEHAEELKVIKVVIEEEKTYTSESLLAGFKVHNTKGLKSKGGEVWFGFSFPPEVMQLVLKPTRYTRLSLMYQVQLRTASSLSLYEVCRRYATNPSHVTNREKWELWFYVITGTPTSSPVPEYKYFKRDHLMKSIAEINAITDIEVELMEYREGRRVVDIQFKVFEKAQATLELPASPVINTALVERIMAFGIPKEEATNIYAAYEEKVVLAHVSMVEARLQNPSAKPVDSAAAYFKDAIAKGYANFAMSEVSVKVKPEEGGQARKPTLLERFVAERAKDALARYEKLPEAEQEKMFKDFSEIADKSLKPYLKKGPTSVAVKAPFSAWLASNWWGEPTQEKLLEFAERALAG